MRFALKNTLFIFVLVFLISCQNDQQRITRRWVITDLQTPTYKALVKAFDPRAIEDLTVALRKKVQGNRLILDKNGDCYGVLMNKYFTGRWDFMPKENGVITHIDFPQKIDLKWLISNKGWSSTRFDIDASKLQQVSAAWQHTEMENAELNDLLDHQGTYSLIAETEANNFNELDADPWSPAMNAWRLKPLKTESKSEIITRVRNHVHFMYSFFSFAIQGERFWVSQDWFFSVIKPAKNGTALLSVKNIPPEWYECFYDSAQALLGHSLLRKTFNANIDVPKESNSLVFNKLMLGELLKAFDKQNRISK